MTAISEIRARRSCPPFRQVASRARYCFAEACNFRHTIRGKVPERAVGARNLSCRSASTAAFSGKSSSVYQRLVRSSALIAIFSWIGEESKRIFQSRMITTERLPSCFFHRMRPIYIVASISFVLPDRSSLLVFCLFSTPARPTYFSLIVRDCELCTLCVTLRVRLKGQHCVVQDLGAEPVREHDATEAAATLVRRAGTA